MIEETAQRKAQSRFRSGERTPARKASDRRKAARLAVAGMTHSEIAAELGISITTVHRDLLTVRERWEAEAARNVFQLRSRELAKAELLESEAWAIFDSAPDSESRLAALDRVAKAIALRCKINGLERFAAVQREIDALQEQSRQVIDRVVSTVSRFLSTEEFERFAAELGIQMHETECEMLDALPVAPAATFALPEPGDSDSETDTGDDYE